LIYTEGQTNYDAEVTSCG